MGSYGVLVGWIVGIIVGLLVFERLFIGIRLIGSDEIAIVEKWWSLKGRLSQGKFIALNGEAGYQAEVLRTGIHLKPLLLFRIHKTKMVLIPQGQIGYVFSRDGQPLQEGQRLAKKVECNNFQDINKFFENGGQKGTQLSILREGIYPLNLANFVVFTSSENYYMSMGNRSEEGEILKIASALQEINAFKPVVIDGSSDLIGIVTVHEGPSLSGEIIAPVVGNDPARSETYHNNFQDPTKFLLAGGFGGRQLQVLTEGTYYLNKKFCSVEFTAKTIIDIGYTGVVNSFVGQEGEDLSGENYKHGELVRENCKGVWETPLKPGKYAINTYAMKVSSVPTTNFILKWMENESGGHRFDENLSSVSLITKDAFTPTLPLSVVVNIDYKKAPLVIQRFGDVKKLVEQTLDPMVSAYFKNVGQGKTLVELIQSRSEIQEQSTKEMKDKFTVYNLELEEVLIGTPSSNNDNKIEEILKQISDRQLAKEQIETYKSKMDAAAKEKELREAEAKAKQQSVLTESAINVEIKQNEAEADLKRAIKDSEKIKTLADANAYQTKVAAEADAMKEARVGIAKALATSEQVQAYGGAQYQVMQDVITKMAQAISQSGVPIVPQNVITMGGADGGSSAPNIFESLIALVMSEKLGAKFSNTESSPEQKAAIDKIKKEILDSLNEEK